MNIAASNATPAIIPSKFAHSSTLKRSIGLSSWKTLEDARPRPDPLHGRLVVLPAHVQAPQDAPPLDEGREVAPVAAPREGRHAPQLPSNLEVEGLEEAPPEELRQQHGEAVTVVLSATAPRACTVLGADARHARVADFALVVLTLLGASLLSATTTLVVRRTTFRGGLC